MVLFVFYLYEYVMLGLPRDFEVVLSRSCSDI